MRFGTRGSVLPQVLIMAALLTIVALASATLVTNVSSQNQIAASRAATMPLAGALRTQLSRHDSCLASFAPRPGAYPGTSEVGVNVGATSVIAGADLNQYGVRVTSLSVTGLSRVATTTTGNALYAGDLVLSTESSVLNSGGRVSFRPVTVAHLLFEVQGASNLVWCNATDPSANLPQQLQRICTSIASVDGLQAGWSGTGCVVYDESAQPRCARLGGTWMGNWCSFPPPTFIVTRTIGTGVPGQTWYGVLCPAGSSITGGTCATASGPNPPLGTAFFGNGFYCQWANGYDTSTFNLYATCAP